MYDYVTITVTTVFDTFKYDDVFSEVLLQCEGIWKSVDIWWSDGEEFEWCVVFCESLRSSVLNCVFYAVGWVYKMSWTNYFQNFNSEKRGLY